MTTTEPAPTSAAPAPVKTYFTGIVKHVMDGGVVVIRGPPRNGPPAERILALTNIDAPKLGRRPVIQQGNTIQEATEDEPFAWEAREFLRKMLVGKPILGHVVHTANREYGVLLVGATGNDPETGEDVAVKLVDEGLAKVRDNCQDQKLKDAQEAASAAKKGIWSGENAEHVRNITWEVENPRVLVDKFGGKPVPAIVEHVRDGTTLRVFLLPDFYHITLMMSGVRSPATRLGPEGRPDANQCEPYAVEAHYFTESRLLQRDVEVILESHNNNNFIGSVLHPSGNIAEALLKEGMAKCVDWSIAKVTGGPERYRAAQKSAQDAKKRIWKDFTATESDMNPKDRDFNGKVVEVCNGDALMVKTGKIVKKVHLASIRPPRQENDDPAARSRQKGFRPLYDIPFMFEAREFLRKKLIGHTVHVHVDYVQPARDAVAGELPFPEKTCCTVTIGGVNVAEAVVSKGLATVVRYAADNDQRSQNYDDLLQAEEKAKKSSQGVHDKKNIPTHRVSDMTGNLAKCKQFLPFLQRAGRMQGLVEFVASGSRFRVYIPRETCIITFLLGGINCPKGARMMPSGDRMPADPFGEEAALWVKEQVLQREVEIEVESMDKAGNFIGYLFVDNSNMNVTLVQEGYATSHFTAERSAYGNQIKNAEDNAKKEKKKVWANYTEEEEVAQVEMEALSLNEDRQVNYEEVVVTEVTNDMKILAQSVADGPALEKLMDALREEFTTNPPLSGAYTAKRSEMCAAKFDLDGQWYRAKVEKISGNDALVCYIDYGNKATIPKASVAALPATFHSPGGYAKVYNLALCSLAPDEELATMGISGLKEDLLDKTVKLNVEYRSAGETFVTLVTPDTNDDIGMGLVQDGLLMVDRKGGRKLAKLQKQYEDAMEFAKKQHLNIWRYGDITEDDAREFGVGGVGAPKR